MTESNRLSQYADLANSLFDLYVDLLGEDQVRTFIANDCPTGQRIDFLDRLRSGGVSFSTLASDDAIEFGSALLDGVAIPDRPERF